MKLKWFILIILLVLIIYPAYLWFTYVDESISEGQGYGFKINTSKEEVYKSLPKTFSNLVPRNSSVYIQVKVTKEMESLLATKEDFSILIKPRFHDVGFEQFEKLDTWSFYIDGDFFNTLELSFCDGKLCKIYRHRKKFELP